MLSADVPACWLTTNKVSLCLQVNYENRRLGGRDQQLSCHVASPPLNQATWDSLDFTVSCCTLAAPCGQAVCQA